MNTDIYIYTLYIDNDIHMLYLLTCMPGCCLEAEIELS